MKPVLKRCEVRLLGDGYTRPGWSCISEHGAGYGVTAKAAYKEWRNFMVDLDKPPARDWLAPPWGILLALLTGISVAYMWEIFK